jgi:ClpP class serine protease
MRPVVTQNFLDKIKMTFQHFYTGSDFGSPFKEMEGEQLAKFRAHIDEMYDDFKSRVSEGRGIHKDVVELLAGGRVMTGWQAFGLIAPREYI